MRRLTKMTVILSALFLLAYIPLSYCLLYVPNIPLPEWLLPFVPDAYYTQLILTFLAGVGILVGVGVLIKTILTPRKLPKLVRYEDGGSLVMDKRAMKNIVYLITETLEGVEEDNVRLRLYRRGGKPCYRVKLRLGIAPDSTIVSQADSIRQNVAQALEHATGIPCDRVDLVIKPSRKINKGGKGA